MNAQEEVIVNTGIMERNLAKIAKKVYFTKNVYTMFVSTVDSDSI